MWASQASPTRRIGEPLLGLIPGYDLRDRYALLWHLPSDNHHLVTSFDHLMKSIYDYPTRRHAYIHMTSYQFDSIRFNSIIISKKILPSPFRVAPCPGAKINVNQTTTSNQRPTAWERVLQNDNQEPKEMASGENPSREQVKARVVDAEMQTRKSKPSPRHA